MQLGVLVTGLLLPTADEMLVIPVWSVGLSNFSVEENEHLTATGNVVEVLVLRVVGIV